MSAEDGIKAYLAKGIGRREFIKQLRASALQQALRLATRNYSAVVRCRRLGVPQK